MEFSRTSDPAVVGVLERGDIFLGTRKRFKNNEWIESQFKYRVLYPAVYFGHSGNWVIRCKGRFRRKEKEEFEIVEHIVINHQCIHKYRFQIGHIMAARQEAMKKVKLKPKELPEPEPKKKSKTSQLTELLKPKAKTPLSKMKVNTK